MFRKYEIWKHISCTDLHIMIVKKVYSSEKYVKVKVFYVDKNGVQYHPAHEVVKIMTEDLYKWKKIS